MKVIGLCGQSGSGKGMVCSFFSELNISCIDLDKVYHDIISTNSDCTMELAEAFGSSVLGSPGINRKALREIVFRSEDSLGKLNEITHKHILTELRREIERIKTVNIADGIIVDAPLLFESGFDRECDASIAVIADAEVKLLRITERDCITREQALLRLNSQKTEQDLIDKCDYVIENNSSTEHLRQKVQELKKIIFN